MTDKPDELLDLDQILESWNPTGDVLGRIDASHNQYNSISEASTHGPAFFLRASVKKQLLAENDPEAGIESHVNKKTGQLLETLLDNVKDGFILGTEKSESERYKAAAQPWANLIENARLQSSVIVPDQIGLPSELMEKRNDTSIDDSLVRWATTAQVLDRLASYYSTYLQLSSLPRGPKYWIDYMIGRKLRTDKHDKAEDSAYREEILKGLLVVTFERIRDEVVSSVSNGNKFDISLKKAYQPLAALFAELRNASVLNPDRTPTSPLILNYINGSSTGPGK